MEIINFVGQNSSEKKSTGFFKKTSGSFKVSSNRRKADKSEVEFALNFPTTEPGFTAGKVHNTLSVKTVLCAIGNGVSSFCSYIRKHFIGLLITLAAVALTGCGTYFCSKYISYKINHTGPVVFDASNDTDIQSLNQMMSLFALNNSYTEEDYVDEELAELAALFDQPVTFQNYKVVAGDTISGIAKKFGLSNISTLISINKIENVRFLAAGQKIKIPSRDGIMYSVVKGDTLQSICEKNNIRLETVLDVNELSEETLTVGQELFLPGVGLDSATLRNAMGEIFKLPIHTSFRWTSDYGSRVDPIKGVQSFHTGTDMACPTGTPIYASMSGTVVFTGISNVFGKYVIIDHGNGYKTLYAHMSKIIATKGQFVGQNTKIGLVGSTGYSTGPHLHFTVYKNGNLVNPMSVLNKSK
ncbi:MAG: M23 family metallopeptidase [Treponema sp.]|nr:M23 family metallopeptidase [Treponema sp.]